jgi:hypothetical protein
MAVISTVKIQDGDDYAIINKSDFDPKIHQVYVDKSRKKKKVVGSVTDGNVDDTLIDGDVVNDGG